MKCDKCRLCFASELRLRSHKSVCSSSSLLDIPEPTSVSAFSLIHSAFRQRFRIYQRKLSGLIDIDLVKKQIQRQ